MAGALEEGNGTKARQTRRFRGPCAFCCVEFAGSRGKLLFCHAGKNEDEALAMERKVPAP